MGHEEKTIVFFDGVCGLCNRSVDLLARLDKRRRLHFAPLQGETARDLLAPDDRDKLGSLVLWQRGETFRRSHAVFRAVAATGGLWKAFRALTILPAPVGDILYRFVARHRYQWFGKRESCRLPTPEEQDRFLP